MRPLKLVAGFALVATVSAKHYDCRQEEEDYDECDSTDAVAPQFDFEMEQSLFEKGRNMAASATSLFHYSISPGFKSVRQHGHYVEK